MNFLEHNRMAWNQEAREKAVHRVAVLTGMTIVLFLIAIPRFKSQID